MDNKDESSNSTPYVTFNYNIGICKTCGLQFDRESNIHPTCDSYFRCKNCRGIKRIDFKNSCILQ